MTSEEQLLGKIKSDLAKSGFITELRAGKIAKAKNCDVRYNSNYLDLDSGKSREFDLDVSLAFGHHTTIMLHIQLNIEVKKSKKPWIIFTEDLEGLETGPGFGIISAFNNFSSWEVLDMKGLMDGFMRLEVNYLGRNFCEAFKDPGEPSKIFESLISISKASLYSKEMNMSPEAKAQEDDPSIYYDPNFPSYFHIIQPVVILEGNLIGAKLGENEEISLTPHNYIPLEIQYTSEKYPHQCFYPDIITLDYFSKYLDKVESWGRKIVKNCKR